MIGVLTLTIFITIPEDLYVYIYVNVILITLPGKIGIRIPSHNSLTPTFLDEILKTAATSRKPPDARRIRSRLPEKYHMAIVSTGLSYLTYLGALKKVSKGYRPTRLGRRIGKLLAKDRVEEANIEWGELLKRHRLFRLFKRYFSSKNNNRGTIEDFGLYLRKRTHTKWDISAIRSRVSRLCELFAEKGLIEYQNGDLSPIDLAQKEQDTPSISSPFNKPQTVWPIPSLTKKKDHFIHSFSANSWPIKIDLTVHISDKTDPKLLEMILSFLKDMKRTQEVPKD